MEHFLIGKALSGRTDISYEKKSEKCKRKRLFEPVSEDEIESTYAQLLSSLSQEFARVPARLSKGVIESGRVRLTKICGKYFRTMGFSFDGSSYLHPEEALYLAECNKIQILIGSIPLSVQQLYDQLLTNETYPQYLAYCRLSSLNFSLRKRVHSDSHLSYFSMTDKLFEIPKSISISIASYPLTNQNDIKQPVRKTKFSDFQPLITVSKIHSITSLMHNLREIVQSTSDRSVKSVDSINLLYDVYGNNHTEKRRIINFSKRSPAHPDYLLSVLSPEQIYPDIEPQSLIKVGLNPSVSIIVCMVDGCDMSFYKTNHFETPNIHFNITFQ
ncbi:tRNA-splicing endonuclease subunit Sen54 isoform 1 [Schistosoma japonicum]|uniref:tRNA-splicing endonuclease subunit Sen54 isoform 1 n=2 Tax=Schistosoma japonicum TaxID=6182 RepID=A0A4Z2DY21_SCHJA|nr:tRNA-splicing endonuclease subunit Sen54 isoform 1 [Schistosoma japonicum]